MLDEVRIRSPTDNILISITEPELCPSAINLYLARVTGDRR